MSFHRFFKNYSLLTRLAFSALFIICVPLLLFVWFSLDQATERLTAQENARHLQVAGQFSNYIQEQRTNIIAVSARISYEGKITLSALDQDKYNEIEAVKELKRYRDLVPLSLNCYIYFRGTDFLLGSDGKYDRGIFLSSSLDFVSGERSRQLMLNALDDSDSPCVFSSFPELENGFENMYFSIPISISRQNDAVVLFTVTRASLNGSFLGKLNSGEYELYIFDSDNTLLASNASSLRRYFDSGELNDFLKNTAHSARLSLGDSKRTLYKVYNERLGMTFVTMPASSSAEDVLSSFYRLIRITVLLLALLMFILLTAFIYINYKPVLETTRRIRTRYGGECESGGELELIEHAFDKKLSENAAILDQLAEQQLLLIDYTVKSILSGKAPIDDELIRCGLDPAHEYYCVMTALPPSSGFSPEALTALHPAMQRLCGARLCVIDSFSDCVMLMLSFERLDKELRSRAAEQIYEILHASCRELFTLGVGTAESSSDRIYVSSVNSKIAAEQSDHPGICFFEEILAFENKPDSYPAEAALRFYQYIRLGSYEPAMTEYDSVSSYVSGIRSTMLEHYVRYDVINSFLKLLCELSVPVSDEERSRLFALTEYTDLRENISTITRRACDEITGRRRSFNQTRMGRIVDYIDSNTSDPDLGLPMIAAHFGISMSSLSSGFNEAMGRGLREYIVERRIEHAKALIKGDSLSIKDIALRVGFRDASYFIKLFKAATGYTPAKYRESSD